MSTIVTRAGKGSPLTNTEVDANFINLNNEKIQSGNTVSELTITSLDSTNADLTNITATSVDADNLEFNALSGTGSVSVTDIADEDDMSSDSPTKLATQQSIKAYVDSQVTSQDLDVTDGTNTIGIDLDSESLGVLGGTGVDSVASGNSVTLSIDSTVATLAGSQTLTNKIITSPDINGGTIDGASIATSDITVGSGKTFDVSAGTLTLADNQISGDKVEGGTIAAVAIDALTFGSINDGNITVTGWVDEDNMSSNSPTLVPTQQSVKDYVDTSIDALNLNQANVFVNTWMGSDFDLGDEFATESPFSIEPKTALRSDLAFDTGSYDFGTV